jgi:hypothetical protein
MVGEGAVETRNADGEVAIADLTENTNHPGSKNRFNTHTSNCPAKSSSSVQWILSTMPTLAISVLPTFALVGTPDRMLFIIGAYPFGFAHQR